MEAFIPVLVDRLLATSLQTALLVAAVWLLCRLLPRMSPATQCWLWWLVALQALVGLAANPVNLPWLPPAPAGEMAALLPASTAITEMQVIDSAATDTFPSWQTILFIAWVAGLLFAAAALTRDWLSARELRRASTSCPDESLASALARAAEACGLRATPALGLSTAIDSPILLGRIRPVLLLPARSTMTPEELDMALMHELMHLRRRDLWWGCVPLLARLFFHFHPLVHLAIREYGTAREAACDVAVVDTERCSRQDYGSLLLRLGTSSGVPEGMSMASTTFLALKRRLTLLQERSFLSRASSIALVGVVAVAGVMPFRLVEGAAATTPPAMQLQGPETVPEQVPEPPPAPPQAVPPVAEAPDDVPRITLNLQDIPVPFALQLIADTGNTPIVVHESVSGTVTVSLQNVPWDEALDVVLRTKNLQKRALGNAIFVVPADGVPTVIKTEGITAQQAAQQFLESQIAELEQRLQEAERLREEFAVKLQSGELPVAEAQEAQRARLQRDYERLRKQHEELIARRGTAAHRQVLADLEQARTRLAQMLLRFTEMHPEIISQKRRIEELEQRIGYQVSGG